MQLVQLARGQVVGTLSGSVWLSDGHRGRGRVSCRGRGLSWLYGALVTSQDYSRQGHAYTLVRACVRVRACGVARGSGWLALGRWGLWVGSALVGSLGALVGSLVALGQGLWLWSGGLVWVDSGTGSKLALLAGSGQGSQGLAGQGLKSSCTQAGLLYRTRRDSKGLSPLVI